jgi:hypothetical protein
MKTNKMKLLGTLAAMTAAIVLTAGSAQAHLIPLVNFYSNDPLLDVAAETAAIFEFTEIAKGTGIAVDFLAKIEAPTDAELTVKNVTINVDFGPGDCNGASTACSSADVSWVSSGTWDLRYVLLKDGVLPNGWTLYNLYEVSADQFKSSIGGPHTIDLGSEYPTNNISYVSFFGTKTEEDVPETTTLLLTAVDVPEPTTLLLLGAGFLGTVTLRRRIK